MPIIDDYDTHLRVALRHAQQRARRRRYHAFAVKPGSAVLSRNPDPVPVPAESLPTLDYMQPDLVDDFIANESLERIRAAMRAIVNRVLLQSPADRR